MAVVTGPTARLSLSVTDCVLEFLKENKDGYGLIGPGRDGSTSYHIMSFSSVSHFVLQAFYKNILKHVEIF